MDRIRLTAITLLFFLNTILLTDPKAPRPISPWSSRSSALKTNSSPLIFSVPVDCEFKLNGNLMSGPVVFDEAIGIAGLVAALVKSLKFRPVGFLKLGWDKLIVRQDRFSCWTGDIIDEGIRPPPGTIGKFVGGTIFRIRCSGTNPSCPPALELLGDVGDIDGVLEFDEADTQPGEAEELFKPRPEPGRLDLSQALYCCSPPRPEPGLESLEKAVLDSCVLAIGITKLQ